MAPHTVAKFLRGVEYMKKKCALEKGDTICILMGNIDNSQQTNTIKIIKV